MANINIGRLGSLGLGIESSPGSVAVASVYLPFTDVSLRGHHTPIEDIASKTSRIMDKDSTDGKKWSEGDIKLNLDMVNSGYLFKMALGQELYAAGSPNVHTFYTTISGNTPTTATLIYSRGDTDIESYLYSSVNDLSLEVSDGLATISASVMGKFPTTGSAQTVTTTSGTVVAFADYVVKFGTDLASAAAASATPVNDFKLKIANNLETIHRSGSNDVSAIRSKGLRVSGEYTVYFDNITDRDAYYNITKRAMEITFTGMSASETLKIRIPKFRLSEGDISTGLDNFFIVKCQYVAEDIVDAAGCRFIDATLRNSKNSTY